MKKDKHAEEEITTNEETIENNQVEEQAETVSEPVNEVQKLEADLAESKDKYIRLYSEFENFRRRTAKEKIETIMNATEGLMKELIPVLDDFERAQKSMETSEDVKAIKEGIDLIFNKFQKTLASKGLKPMESKDQTFDVELHECITQFAAGDDKKGTVVDEIEKGYYLNDKVIRYAKVVVGS
ncbi:nucleotide exchange factor GrpE [Lacihabitans soyangensis]|jgi:molecular chaperone GrpE|uniref:Protein GrpE n=1 Tax=Lacihabitans soyangensis TaxID=869394 RepID=A0AAE3H2T9_9BACT|nr:nucleotide exchange factor GrpE [Lacihabitans soyangensis]MCP9763587.1 nucleotide exchange factor GrpE [Lacihabitans soyangensis]